MPRPFLIVITLLLSVLSSYATSISLLVLPFSPESNTAKYIWIGESNAEGIADILAKNRIFILDREDRLRAYRSLGIQESPNRTLATSLKVAMELDADFAVLGGFQVVEAEPVGDGRVTLAITVMDVRKWRKMAEVRIEGKLADLCVLETRAAYLILKAIQADQATDSEAAFLARFPPVRLDARENYIRGLLADTDEARHRHFTQAARLDETYAAPAFQLGSMYWQKRDCRHAAEWLRKVIEEFPRKRESQFMLGVCEARLGRYAEAEAVLRALYAAAPLPEVANNLAVVLGRQRKEGVLELLTYAVERDSEEPDYRFNLGHALWLRERYEDAAERFREVLDLAGEDAEATRMLGRSLQGDASRAARAAVENLGRLKEDFNDNELSMEAAGRVSGVPVLPAIP